MLSAISVIKVAVQICNNHELKREILCVPETGYDIKKRGYRYFNKMKWNEIVKKKAAVTLRNLGVPKVLQKKVMGVVLPIGMRMRTWAEYHEGTLGLSREYSINFLNSSFFTQQGIIDNKKAAGELMNDKNLNLDQKCELACLYCFTDYVPALYRQMTNEDKEKFYSIRLIQWFMQPDLETYYSYFLTGDADVMNGKKTLDQYRLEKAVENGNKAAVEYCLERNLRRKRDAVIDAAVEAVRNRRIIRDDWIVFRDRRYDDSKETWVPNDYFVDIVSFLLSKMTEDQKTEFLKKDVEGVKYESYFHEPYHRRSRVLEYFLYWPYQDYFMKTAGLMWEFLPERNYADLLLKICGMIEPMGEINKLCGEEKNYDYRGLLKEFWDQSPERYKRYVLSNQAGVRVLNKLLELKNFTHEDRKNIKLILASATDKEKVNILSSKGWRGICIELMEAEKWEILGRFVQNCFSSKEEADKFKRELIFTKEAQRICTDFVKYDKWDAAESAIKWIDLPEGEINKFKREMIYSRGGIEACADLVSYDNKIEAVDKFSMWCFPSAEELNAFKKELVFSYEGICKCADLIIEGQLELANEFINFGLSSSEEIKELKKNLAYRKGSSVCERLIADFSEGDIWDDQCCGYIIGLIDKFEGGKWEEVEEFLTWCFSSEEEISYFKKNQLLQESGNEIHFNLIRANQWEEAETFFAWLGLSAEEIKELKKDTLFNYYPAGEMFNELMYSGEKFVDYGSKEEAIELLLRWYLTDKETVLEFKDEFKRQHYGGLTEKCKAMSENFDLMIKQRLKDLDEEKRGAKRKSETFSANKRLNKRQFKT